MSKAEKHHVLTAIKTGLPPMPTVGRPRREDVTEALRLETDTISLR